MSPYEADAQLAWLAKRPSTAGGVAAVISEDSDLLAYGCPVVRTMSVTSMRSSRGYSDHSTAVAGVDLTPSHLI